MDTPYSALRFEPLCDNSRIVGKQEVTRLLSVCP